MITAHTDAVGSRLQPGTLRKARNDWVAGRLGHAQFKSNRIDIRGSGLGSD
jgi:methionine synthase II (cobalamin-independent)